MSINIHDRREDHHPEVSVLVGDDSVCIHFGRPLPVLLQRREEDISFHESYGIRFLDCIRKLVYLNFAEVQKGERDCGRQLYDQEREIIRETVAFGRRSEGPPNLYYPREISAREPTRPGKMNNSQIRRIAL